MIEQIANGLTAFHRLEMLHQDLRPQNVMIDASGTVKIIDFGATRVAGISEIDSPLARSELLGTMQYTAPEYFLGESGTPRSDLFSLGVIAYQMLSGRLPYDAEVPKARTRAAQRQLKYRSVLDDEREIPAWIDEVLRKATHPDPTKRYEELSEFVYELAPPEPGLSEPDAGAVARAQSGRVLAGCVADPRHHRGGASVELVSPSGTKPFSGLERLGMMSKPSCGFLLPFLLLAWGPPALAVDIDGRVGDSEWQGAEHITDFRKTQPLTGEPPSHATEAWILSTPEGLAVALRNTQPASVPRTQQRVQRDFEEQVDRVNVIVDFDGDGRTGYNFRVSSTDDIYDGVVTDELQFNKDWDGNWKHAVGVDDSGWTVEVLIPWYIASMRDAKGDKRTIKIYLDRIIGTTGERVAWPQASLERSRFLSDFAAIEVANHSQALFAATPYVSGLYDNVGSNSDGDAGVDVVWKPNGQMQLTATVNPDFGQVESDDLVVNFSATETFVSDKRPFFTENQGLFEYTTPSDYSQLLYTRRVGGPADDGEGSGDITAALKLNGSIGATKYGVFGADEGDTVGRTFGALRVVRDFAKQNLGVMATYVDRPYLDREAAVFGVDHNWRPNARWNVRTRVFGSDIEQEGNGTSDTGATVWADYEMDHGWRQQLIAMHFGNDLQINDAGYLSRNSTNYLHWQVNRRFTDMPETSRYSSKDWRGRVSTDYNDRGTAAGSPVPREPREPAARRQL